MFLQVAGSTLLLFAIWPALRLLAEPRLLRWNPRTYLGVAVLVLLCLNVVLWRPPLGLPLALFIAALRLYNRVRWWRNVLPPGSLSAPNVKPQTDAHYFENLAARHGPIFKTSSLFQPTFCVADLDLGWDLLGQKGLQSPPLRYDRLLPGGGIRYMEAERHKRYRGLIAKAVTGEVVEKSRPYFVGAVKRAVESLRANPQLEPHMVMRRMVEEAMVGALLGLTPAEPDFEKSRNLLHQIDLGRVERDILPWKPAIKRMTRAAGELVEYLLNTHRGPMPAALSEEELREPVVAHNLVVISHIACRDVAGLLTWMLDFLGKEPEWLELSTPEAIVWETLRLEQSEYLIRKTTNDVHWKGYRIPKGWLIRVCVREGHRRAPIQEPSSFLPTRPAAGFVRPFGAHEHTCPGRKMTLLLGRLLVKELSCYRLSLLRSGQREFDGWHWTPGKGLRVLVVPK